MATPSVVPASNLKCSICLDLFSDPRVLPCLHIYCLKCLRGLVSKEKSDLSCPQCRAKHEIPKGDVANYLRDLSILPELKTAKATTKKESKMCGLCTSGEVAVGYCQDCCEYLCSYCQDVHKKMKMFTTHKIASMEALSTIIYATKQVALCPHHSEYKLEIFCKTCDMLVCSMCMLESSHKGHSYDFLKNVQHELMKRIKSTTQSIERKGKEFKSCLVSVEKFEQRVCSQRDKLEAEINAVCDEYISKIQAMKEELLKQVESKFTEDSKTIWATKNHLEVLLSQVESCQAFSERYQKQGSEGQMLSLLNQLLNRLTELDSAVADTSVIFSSTIPLTDFKKSVLNLSSLGTLTVAKDATFTQGSFQDKARIYEDEKTTLVYILNEPIAHLVKWECKYGYSYIMTSTCPVVVSNDNQLEIEFTPTVSGTYSFQLIPTGCPIVGIQKFTLTTHTRYNYLYVTPMIEDEIPVEICSNQSEEDKSQFVHEESISLTSLEYSTELPVANALLINEESISPDVLVDSTELPMANLLPIHKESISLNMPEDSTKLPMPDPLPMHESLSPSYGLASFYSNTSPTLSSNSTTFSKSSPPTTSSYGLTFPNISTSGTSNYRKRITVGARVKRGPDWGYWTHGNQDGGVGNLGTVVCHSTKRGYDVVVRWDGKVTQYDYRWGSQKKYEVELVS